ncbi:MAG: hypothetical protein CR994_03685 [Maribacter sp.]|nr:MAG: hypothetical protein CR994_03685 [Maribacter sp.]
MKKLSAFLILFSVVVGYSQENLNGYKYIIVPKKFEPFKKENQYKTSTLVKYLFVKEGFNVVYDDALPTELKRNRCLGLQVFLIDESSMFTTKTALLLKDCASKEVLTTMMGSSKGKEYENSYRDALTKAFTTIKALNYRYSPKEVEKTAMMRTAPRPEEEHPRNKVDGAVVKQVANPKDQLYKSIAPVESTIKKAESVERTGVSGEQGNSDMLYAQQIANGYQLVDGTPKIRLKIYHTSLQDVFSVQYDKDNGVVFKKDGKWYLEYSSDGQIKKETLNIKF